MNIPLISTSIFSLMVILGSFGFIMKGNKKLLAAFLTSYLGFLFFIFLENKLKFQINDFIILLVVITIFVHYYIGLNLRFYYTKFFFDRSLHLFGTIAFSFFAYSTIIKTIKPPVNPSIFLFIFVLSLGVFIGVICELIEFLIDSIKKTKNQNGLNDTNFDLIFDIFGAIVAGILVVYNPNWFS